LKVFENRVLRRTYGPKREEVHEVWRGLHNEEIHNTHNLYASPNIIQVINSSGMRWVGHVAYMGEIRNPYNNLLGKSDSKRPLRKCGNRW